MLEISQEQANALALFKTNKRGMDDFIHGRDNWSESYRSLAVFTVDSFARLLYEPNSFKIEHSDKVNGVWVRSTQAGDDYNVRGYIDTTPFEDVIFNYYDMENEPQRRRLNRSDVALMTPEEIALEENRRLFISLGRKVGEFKTGDVGISSNQDLIRNVGSLGRYYTEGHLTGFFPAEEFITFLKEDAK